MERPPIGAVAEVGVGLLRLLARAALEDRHGAQQDGVVPPHALEVDLGELDRRHVARPNERREAIDGKEGDVGLVARDGTTPRLDPDGRALEGVSLVLAPQLLHERAGPTGIRLELERGRFSVSERSQRGLLLPEEGAPRVGRRRAQRGGSERAGRGGRGRRPQEAAALHAGGARTRPRVVLLRAHLVLSSGWVSRRSRCRPGLRRASGPGPSGAGRRARGSVGASVGADRTERVGGAPHDVGGPRWNGILAPLSGSAALRPPGPARRRAPRRAAALRGSAGARG